MLYLSDIPSLCEKSWTGWLYMCMFWNPCDMGSYLEREDEISPKVRAHTFLPYRHIGCVLRSSENPNTALLTCILHKDLLSSWDKGMGNKLSLKTYLLLFCFATIHIRFQIDFLFWKSQDLPSDCSYCPTKDRGPVIGLTLSFINFGTKFLVADLSSLVKEQAGKGEPWLWRKPSLQPQSFITCFHFFLQCDFF